jgi:hypothetical protein
MLGRHSPTELCPQPQISFFPPSLAILGFELRALCLQSGNLLLEQHCQPPHHSDFQCGSVKGTVCAPVHIYFLIFRCHGYWGSLYLVIISNLSGLGQNPLLF